MDSIVLLVWAVLMQQKLVIQPVLQVLVVVVEVTLMQRAQLVAVVASVVQTIVLLDVLMLVVDL